MKDLILDILSVAFFICGAVFCVAMIIAIIISPIVAVGAMIKFIIS